MLNRATLTLKEIYFLMHPDSSKSRADKTLEKLDTKRILCLSDGTNVSIFSNSLAICLAQKAPHRQMSITQADYSKPSNGKEPTLASLKTVQALHHYRVINNETFSPAQTESYDLVLARNVLCFCQGYLSCGGLPGNCKAISNFFEHSLIANQPKMAVLTANFLPEYMRTLKIFRDGKSLVQKACMNLANKYPEYEFVFIDKFTNLYFCSDPDAEPGYAVILIKRGLGIELIERNEDTQTYPAEQEHKEPNPISSLHRELFDWFAKQTQPPLAKQENPHEEIPKEMNTPASLSL